MKGIMTMNTRSHFNITRDSFDNSKDNSLITSNKPKRTNYTNYTNNTKATRNTKTQIFEFSDLDIFDDIKIQAENYDKAVEILKKNLACFLVGFECRNITG